MSTTEWELQVILICVFKLKTVINQALKFQFAVLDQLSVHQKDVKETAFWEPFVDFPEDFDAETRNRLQRDAEKVIRDYVQPGMASLTTCLKEEYLPHTRPEIGASSLPDGEKFYDQVCFVVSNVRTK